MSDLKRIQNELNNILYDVNNTQKAISDLQNYMQNKQDTSGTIYVSNVTMGLVNISERVKYIANELQRYERKSNARRNSSR